MRKLGGMSGRCPFSCDTWVTAMDGDILPETMAFGKVM
jgi:hypothetical protein